MGCAAANTTALASYITPWQQYRNMILLALVIIGIFAGATIRIWPNWMRQVLLYSAIGILALYFALYVLSLEPALPAAGANCVGLLCGTGAQLRTFCSFVLRLVIYAVCWVLRIYPGYWLSVLPLPLPRRRFAWDSEPHTPTDSVLCEASRAPFSARTRSAFRMAALDTFPNLFLSDSITGSFLPVWGTGEEGKRERKSLKDAAAAAADSKAKKGKSAEIEAVKASSDASAGSSGQGDAAAAPENDNGTESADNHEKKE